MMTRTKRFTLFAGLATCVLFSTINSARAQTDPAIPSLSNDQVTRLNNGEIVLDVVPGAVPVGDAMGVVDYTPEQVFNVVSDFDKHGEFMSDLALAEVTGTDGDALFCHGITDTPWPMDDREWIIRAGGGPTEVDGVNVYLVAWTYVPDSGNLVDTNGYWLAMPWGADGTQTLLRYRIQVDLGTWLPDFLLSWSTENFLPWKVIDIRNRLDALNAN